MSSEHFQLCSFCYLLATLSTVSHSRFLAFRYFPLSTTDNTDLTKFHVIILFPK